MLAEPRLSIKDTCMTKPEGKGRREGQKEGQRYREKREREGRGGRGRERGGVVVGMREGRRGIWSRYSRTIHPHPSYRGL